MEARGRCDGAGGGRRHRCRVESSASVTGWAGMRTPTVWRCFCFCFELLIMTLGICLLAGRMKV